MSTPLFMVVIVLVLVAIWLLNDAINAAIGWIVHQLANAVADSVRALRSRRTRRRELRT